MSHTPEAVCPTCVVTGQQLFSGKIPFLAVTCRTHELAHYKHGRILRAIFLFGRTLAALNLRYISLSLNSLVAK